ncbi:MAG: hypothetical protein MJ187_00720 [Alphaproteobacteria bacterium]|nr:hypothetical protein [Alphaproteobacteria bacterium]
MIKKENLFIGACLGLILIAMGANVLHTENRNIVPQHQATKYGSFLAAQHAITVNDFGAAAHFVNDLQDVNYSMVQNAKYIAEFLNGNMSSDVEVLKNEKNTAARMIYDAFLVNNDNWTELYARHKSDFSALAAPLRIWASVASGNTSDALSFIEKLPTNDSWKSFIRGQIFVETGDLERATAEFDNVSTDFMNINDYIYIMSFYRDNDMPERADDLHNDFTSRPGGVFMTDFDNIPNWSNYIGYKNALAFDMIQTVSHSQMMMYSDLMLLMLRFAEITGPSFTSENDAINYYLGQFFFNNGGNYQSFFNTIDSNSPYYLFTVMRTAEKTGNLNTLKSAIQKNPLFVPGINKLIATNIKNGKKHQALRIINAALNNQNISDTIRAFFIKNRANIHFMFDNLSAAQSDIQIASKTLVTDPEILSLQAKIWASQGRELENAYDYAMKLVRHAPTDINAWNTLGLVIAAREGPNAALEILERIGQASVENSALFEYLGDLYMKTGNIRMARESYARAIELSDDGLIIVQKINKKLRDLK